MKTIQSSLGWKELSVLILLVTSEITNYAGCFLIFETRESSEHYLLQTFQIPYIIIQRKAKFRTTASSIFRKLIRSNLQTAQKKEKKKNDFHIGRLFVVRVGAEQHGSHFFFFFRPPPASELFVRCLSAICHLSVCAAVSGSGFMAVSPLWHRSVSCPHEYLTSSFYTHLLHLQKRAGGAPAAVRPQQ